MKSCLQPYQALANTFHIILLWQISLTSALPVNNERRSGHFDARDISAPDLSGAAGKIGGAAFALILLSLGFGLGAASIAIFGSIEWREFRDRKKPKVPQKDENGPEQTQRDAAKRLDRAETGLSESTVDEMEKQTAREAQGRRERSRLTLKSFLPIDFGDLKPGWLGDTNRK